MLMVGSSPKILLQLVAAFEAVRPLVAQPRKPEDLQKLLRLVQLAGKVTLQKHSNHNNIHSVTREANYE